VSELTGLIPRDGRDGFALWVAVVFGRLARSHPAPHLPAPGHLGHKDT